MTQRPDRRFVPAAMTPAAARLETRTPPAVMIFASHAQPTIEPGTETDPTVTPNPTSVAG